MCVCVCVCVCFAVWPKILWIVVNVLNTLQETFESFWWDVEQALLSVNGSIFPSSYKPLIPTASHIEVKQMWNRSSQMWSSFTYDNVHNYDRWAFVAWQLRRPLSLVFFIWYTCRLLQWQLSFAIDLATLYCALKMEFTFRSKLNVAFPLNVITFRIDLVSKLFLLDLDIQDVNSALCV